MFCFDVVKCDSGEPAGESLIESDLRNLKLKVPTYMLPVCLPTYLLICLHTAYLPTCCLLVYMFPTCLHVPYLSACCLPVCMLPACPHATYRALLNCQFFKTTFYLSFLLVLFDIHPFIFNVFLLSLIESASGNISMFCFYKKNYEV